MERTSDVWLRLALFLGLVLAVQCRPNGAPIGTCTTMTPGHGTEQTGASPYNVTVNVNSYVNGTPVEVTIRGTFQGLLIQARAVGSTDPVGTFSDPGSTSNLKLLGCGSAAGSAVTHANTNAKTDSVLTWNPPATPVGDIEFVATVAEKQLVWWMMIKSSQLAGPTTDDTTTAHGSYMFSAISLLLAMFGAMRVYW